MKKVFTLLKLDFPLRIILLIIIVVIFHFSTITSEVDMDKLGSSFLTPFFDNLYLPYYIILGILFVRSLDNKMDYFYTLPVSRKFHFSYTFFLTISVIGVFQAILLIALHHKVFDIFYVFSNSMTFHQILLYITLVNFVFFMLYPLQFQTFFIKRRYLLMIPIGIFNYTLSFSVYFFITSSQHYRAIAMSFERTGIALKALDEMNKVLNSTPKIILANVIILIISFFLAKKLHENCDY